MRTKRPLALIAFALCVFVAVAGLKAAEPNAIGPLSYQIYGKLHASADVLDDGEESSLYLSSNSSRIGLKGDAKLQNDMSVVWQVESQANIDETGLTWASRDSYVGLERPQCGRIIFGRHDSPYKTLGRKTDLFGDQIGDTRNIYGIGSSGFDLRLDNVIMYTTPKMAGLTAAAAYKTPDSVKRSDVGSGSLTWGSENLTIAAAFEQHGTMVSGTDTNKDGKADVASAENEQGVRVGASWKVGGLTLDAVYEHLIDVGGVDGADRDTVGGGAAYKFGNVTAKGQYYSSGDTDGQPDSGADLVAAGLDYSLSKSATVYVAYAQTVNDDNAKVSASGGGHGNKVVPITGEDNVGYGLGMMYSF